MTVHDGLRLLGFLAGMLTASAVAASPTCAGSLAKPFAAQPEGHVGFRLLITRFTGSEPLAGELGPSLRDELTRYMRHELRQTAAHTAGLRAGDVQVRYADCLIRDRDHDEARRYGQQVEADVVFFGQALAEDRQALARQAGKALTVQPKIAGSVTLSGRYSALTKVEVRIAGRRGSFKTYVTVVSAPQLETSGGREVGGELLKLTLPELTTAEPLALFHFALGLVAYRQQRHGLAARYFEQTMVDVEGAEDVAGLYRIRGRNYLLAGPSDPGLRESEAVERGMRDLEMSLKRCSAIDRDCQAISLHNLGWAFLKQGDYRRSLECYQKALPLERELGERRGEAATLNDIGGVYQALGDNQRALKHYEMALLLLVRLMVGRKVDLEGVAATLNGIGSAYYALGNNQRAMENFEKALPLDKSVGNRKGVATTLSNIGMVHSARGDKQRALENLEEALPLHQQVGDRSGEATTLNNIGTVHNDRGDKQRAMENFEKALPLYRQVGDRSGEATTLNNIGAVYSSMGEKQRALDCYDKAMLLLRQVGDLWSQCTLFDNIASIQEDLGQYAEAIRSYQQAATLYLQRNLPPQPADINNATSSLDRALQVAIHRRLGPQGRSALAELRRLGASALYVATLEAQLLSRIGSIEALRAVHQQLSQLAASQEPGDRAKFALASRAQQERMQRSGSFDGCAGVLVLASSQALARVLQPGDVLLRYQGTCLEGSKDLTQAQARVSATKEVHLVYWRNGRPATVQVQADLIGVTLAEF